MAKSEEELDANGQGLHNLGGHHAGQSTRPGQVRLPFGQIVIQCPACQTKFAVDSSLLDGVEVPRFHCSRCDDVFTMEQTRQAHPPKLVSAAAEDDSISWSEQCIPPSRGEESARGLEMPQFSSRPSLITPPHESFDDEEFPLQYGSNQMSLEFSDARAPSSDENISHPTAGDDLEPISSKSLEQEGFLPPQNFHGTLTKAPPPRVLEEFSPFRSFAVVVGPLFLFLTLIVLFGFYLQTNPHIGLRFAELVIPSAPRVAPPGLYVKENRFKEITLDSGDKAYLVLGRIRNETSVTFRDLTLEAVAFDALGKPLVRTRIKAGNTLAKARVRSLTPEMIRNIQSAPDQESPLLKPHENFEFTIALGDGGLPGELTQGDLSKARYYLARIYSVRRL